MDDLRYFENYKILPILKPQDITETATLSEYFNIQDAVGFVTILCQFGVITGDTCDVTVLASTAASTVSETALAFNYRLSAAVATDTLGDITAATSAGVGIGAGDDAKVCAIFIDPAGLAADKKFLHVVATPASSSMSVCLVNMIAMFKDRYAGNSLRSAT